MDPYADGAKRRTFRLFRGWSLRWNGLDWRGPCLIRQRMS